MRADCLQKHIGLCLRIPETEAGTETETTRRLGESDLDHAEGGTGLRAAEQSFQVGGQTRQIGNVSGCALVAGQGSKVGKREAF